MAFDSRHGTAKLEGEGLEADGGSCQKEFGGTVPGMGQRGIEIAERKATVLSGSLF